MRTGLRQPSVAQPQEADMWFQGSGFAPLGAEVPRMGVSSMVWGLG